MDLAILSDKWLSSTVPLHACNTADVTGFATEQAAVAMKYAQHWQGDAPEFLLLVVNQEQGDTLTVEQLKDHIPDIVHS